MRRALTVIGLTLMLAGCARDSGTPPFERTDAAQPPTGAVPRGNTAEHAVLTKVPPVSDAMLVRGAERYQIFCTPCHGVEGSGDTAVVRRGFPRPPSLTDERLRAAPPDHIVRVISKGIGAMYPMDDRVPAADRWAIAAHVRVLQQQRASGAQ